MYLSSLRKEKLDRLLTSLDLNRMTDFTLTNIEALKDELDATRLRGHSTDNQEFMVDMTAIAVPIRDDRGRLLTTLSLHAPSQRNDVAGLERFLPELKRAARSLEELAIG
jgi:DNA-binding IclR family transcriptional regulator